MTPEIIAHRGASADAPENTLAAIQLAWQQGADATEIDVQLTADGQLVAIHDETLLRTGGVDWSVKDCTLAKLKTRDVGSWKSPQFAGERIPTLAEVLDIVPPDKRLFIELKCGVDAIPELVRVLSVAKTSREQTVLISLDFDTIVAVKRALRNRLAMWVTVQSVRENRGREQVVPPSKQLIKKALAGNLDGLDINDLTQRRPGDIALIQQAGLKSCAWTVNSAERALWLQDEGMESITTDAPERLAKVVRQLTPPVQLPPCWWIEFTFRDGGKMLTRAASSRDELRNELRGLRKYGPSWPSQPTHFRIVPEQSDNREQRSSYGQTLRDITVRWNWIRRHVDALSELPVRTCRVLPITDTKVVRRRIANLESRLGGRALLPAATPWPMCGQPSRPATYLGTYDLRGMFEFGNNFPDGVSLFLRTEEDWPVADLDCDEGAAVSLFAKQKLEFRSPPPGTQQLNDTAIEAWDMPDFPRRPEGFDIYGHIQSIEPWSDHWLNVPGRKIGGFPQFQQGDILLWLQEDSRNVEWHWIGAFEGLIEIGDGGTVYLLAGFDRKKKTWKWHVEWQGG